MKKLILLGGGGHCKSCVDVIEQENIYEIVGILDEKNRVGEQVLKYRIVGTDDDIKKYVSESCMFLITIGQIKTSSLRKKIHANLIKNNAQLATVISPRAYVSKYAEVGEGSIIMHDVLINAAVKIGRNCIINTKALIEHDVVVDDFCHISTAAVVNGAVKIKEGTFWGSNAVSRERVETSKCGFIKAGSVYKGVE